MAVTFALPRPTARNGVPRALRRPVTIVALCILALLIIAAIAAPLLTPFNPVSNELADAFQLPSGKHWLGTDEFGRDLLARIIYGGRVSLVGVAEAVAVYLALGLTAGIIAGYVGGVFESIVVWIADVAFALPQIIVVLTILAIFANDSSAAMLALGLLGAPGLAVFVRGATKTVRAEPYISAARVSGLRTAQILIRHILPRIASPVIVQVALFAGTALLFQTGLDFLGLGTQPPAPSWGAMVSDGANYIGKDTWMVMPAGIVIVLAIVSFNLIGDALQDLRGDRVSASAVSVGAAIPGTGALTEQHIPGTISPERAAAPVSPSAVLSVRDLCIGTDSAPIVRNATFSLEPGECLGIVGESGCGKTMTALAIIGLLPEGVRTTSGSVLFRGTELQGASEREYGAVRGSGIAMISQEPAASLDPSFTVGDQIVEVIRRHSRLSRAAARAESLSLLAQVRLPDPAGVARRFPHQLSGGMAQRVLIAIALAGKPAVLIADEPTTALDVTVQAEILELLRSLRTEMGLAVVLVSHDWGVIADSCDSALVMYAGQVVEEAPIDAVFTRPRHPYSYALMESNPQRAAETRSILPSVPGSVPPVGQWPVGCHFAARCAFATDACREAPIALDLVADQHWTRCIHPTAVPSPALPSPTTVSEG
ncbi:MAG: oligopeptide/dipeptide transporter, ATPase subunit [Microbacteriaceae bacterium]|nr:oligopeptide/dipeptide transporter, ATPase subunit [Microbacteriaceae bacterium]